MRQAVQDFVTSLLDHARTSMELEVMLNFNHEPSHEIWCPGQRQTLERLKLAIRYKQKTVSWAELSRSKETWLKNIFKILIYIYLIKI